jgi:hypothetical protein
MIQVTIPDDALAQLTASDEDDEQDQALNVEGLPQGEDEGANLQSDEDEPDPAADEKPDVPYSRFSEVIAAKNAAKAEADELKRQLEEYKAGNLDYSDDDYDEPDYSVEGRLERMELKEATQQLDAEVAAARAQFPDVPEAVLYKAVSEDPTLDVTVVAERYSNHIAGIEQRAIDKYLAANPAAQRVPPKLKTSGSAGSTKSKPKTLAEAHAAMRSAVRSADW